MPWLFLLALLAAEPAPPPGQIVIIRMYVPPEMPRQFAADTRDVATRLLDQNGITPVWVVCPADDDEDRRCELPIDPAEIVARTLFDRSNYGMNRCGEAYLRRSGGGQMITLFMDCSEAVGHLTSVSPALVHGHMLVHELGHVLLGPDHSVAGIMQCPLELRDWYVAALGRLNFTADQIHSLQQGAADRWATPPPTTGATPLR